MKLSFDPRPLLPRATRTSLRAASLLAFAALVLTGCPIQKREALDPSTMPEAVRPDYELFAQRCSKCHSLQRPLSSGITDDEQWRLYVTRMRRQPGSGISEQDQVAILRFLHYYSQEQLKKKASTSAASPAPSADTSATDGGAK